MKLRIGLTDHPVYDVGVEIFCDSRIPDGRFGFNLDTGPSNPFTGATDVFRFVEALNEALAQA